MALMRVPTWSTSSLCPTHRLKSRCWMTTTRILSIFAFADSRRVDKIRLTAAGSNMIHKLNLTHYNDATIPAAATSRLKTLSTFRLNSEETTPIRCISIWRPSRLLASKVLHLIDQRIPTHFLCQRLCSRAEKAGTCFRWWMINRDKS